MITQNKNNRTECDDEYIMLYEYMIYNDEYIMLYEYMIYNNEYITLSMRYV